MTMTRRELLLGSALACCIPSVLAKPARPRIIVIGGGWGGLAAASQLAVIADVLLIERNASFLSWPLSNRWLAGLDDGRRLHQDYAAAATALGYRFLRDEVQGIDRERRQVRTTQSSFPYDWLIVAAGIGEADLALFAGDTQAAAFTRQHFASAYSANHELAALQAKLAGFSGGDFLLSLPPAPYRCPPAPYERAVIIADMIKRGRLKARLTVVDPNPPWPAYQRIFNDFYRDQVRYLPNTTLRQLDPYKKVASLDIDELHFDEAIIMPPQQAAGICRRTGLTAADSVWAAVNSRNFQFLDDPQIFVIGDSVGSVSPLFGHYPKTGQLAARMGQIVAAEINGRVTDRVPEPTLPESTCFAYLNLRPAQFTRIETRYRVRGDGALIQSIKQQQENNPQGEEDLWLNAWHRSLFGSTVRV